MSLWPEIDKEIEKLEAELEQIKADRIEAGLPPEPPANFVPSAVIKYIYDHTDVKKLHAYVVRLAKLTLDSEQIPPINPDDVLAMIPYYELLRWSDKESNISAFPLFEAASIFQSYDKFKDAEDLARWLLIAAGLLRDEYGAYARCICDSKVEVTEIDADYLAELLEEARQKDEIIRKERKILKEMITYE